MRCSKVAVFLVWLVASSVPVSAHPHIWVDVQAEVTIADGVVDGVWINWTFDDDFSQLILMDNDPDKTGNITPTINASIKRTYFNALADFDYYCHVEIAGRKLNIPSPKQFQSSLTTEGRVRYRFFLPFKTRLTALTTLILSCYDDTYYTDLEFLKKDPLVLKVIAGGTGSYRLIPNKAKSFWGGFVTPIFAVIKWNPE